MKGHVGGPAGDALGAVQGGARHAARRARCVALEVMDRCGHHQAFTRATRAAAAAVALCLVGCAHAPSPGGSSAPVVGQAPAAVEVPSLPTPQTQEEARRALEIAFAAEGVGDVALAAAQLDAVLGSDFLTDAGRMNVYWHAAKAHRRLGNTRGERNALEGFWLSAQLVHLNDDERARTAEAEILLRSLQGHPPAFAPSRAAGQVVTR
jgi:hypothetical protein